MIRNIPRENAERRHIKSVWANRLVTASKSEDGSEEYWDLRNRVTPHDVAPTDLDAEWIACEWPVMSEWRSGSCSRMVPQNSDGKLSLCWQHLDASFSDMLSRLRGGDFNFRQVEKLVSALLNSKKFEPNGSPNWHPDIATFVEEQINRYLISMLHDDNEYPQKTWMHRPARRQIEERISELIEKRIQQKWGAE